MSSKYLIRADLIPKDGSVELVERFAVATRKENTELLVFPDVHYKKGARVTNGLLTASRDRIYPSMLGVTNCGFTFGKISGATISNRSLLERSFEEYSKVLKAYSRERLYSDSYISELFFSYLKKEFSSLKNADLFAYLGVASAKELTEAFEKYFPKRLIPVAARTLGTLGGGNHFFEIHFVEESYCPEFKEGDVYFILHSDSIAVGDKVNLLFSNLSELHHLRGLRHFLATAINRARQFKYFFAESGHGRDDFKNLTTLLYSQSDFRSISSCSEVGKALLFNFFFASVFGEMNRDAIVSGYQAILERIKNEFCIQKMGSHSHDSISVQAIEEEPRVVQRNGVQDIKGSEYYCLPGALGTESYIMRNTNNKNAYYSANHGVGRVLDKHIAKEAFSEADTLEKLAKLNMKIYRVGKGNIGEQNPDAFKDVFAITEEMQDKKLGLRAAKLRPLASLKG